MPALRRAPLMVAMLVTALLVLTAAFAATAANATPILIGNTLLITDGDDSGGLTGSYFVMRDSRGTEITNSSTGLRYTLLRGGSTGLRLLTFTEAPDPAFDRSGNALASDIIQPTLFAGVRFSVATPRVDPITRAANTEPQIIIDLLRGEIIVNLDAWTVYWNGQTFDQGAAGRRITITLLRDGRIRITIEWDARITAGAFSGFTGNWHIEGVVSNL